MTSIRCKNRNHEHYHYSLEESRQCYGLAPNALQPLDDEWLGAHFGGEPAQYPQPKVKPAERKMPPNQATEPGLYKLRDDIYKIRISKRTERPYAMVLSWDEDNKPFWEYWKGRIFLIKAHMKLTAEQAAKFGKQEGQCVNCFKELTRGESIRRGYGPTCAKNHGWPYDHSSKD